MLPPPDVPQTAAIAPAQDQRQVQLGKRSFNQMSIEFDAQSIIDAEQKAKEEKEQAKKEEIKNNQTINTTVDDSKMLD